MRYGAVLEGAFAQPRLVGKLTARYFNFDYITPNAMLEIATADDFGDSARCLLLSCFGLELLPPSTTPSIATSSCLAFPPSAIRVAGHQTAIPGATVWRLGTKLGLRIVFVLNLNLKVKLQNFSSIFSGWTTVGTSPRVQMKILGALI